MSALSLSLLCFLQPILGLFVAPMAMAYIDAPNPVETVIDQMWQAGLAPNARVLFVGSESRFTPMAVDVSTADDSFAEDMDREATQNRDTYGLAIVDYSSIGKARFFDLLNWCWAALHEGGWFVVYDFERDRFVMSFRKARP